VVRRLRCRYIGAGEQYWQDRRSRSTTAPPAQAPDRRRARRPGDRWDTKTRRAPGPHGHYEYQYRVRLVPVLPSASVHKNRKKSVLIKFETFKDLKQNSKKLESIIRFLSKQN
jgi:hypothetical protein